MIADFYDPRAELAQQLLIMTDQNETVQRCQLSFERLPAG